jgi:hypothetical protein
VESVRCVLQSEFLSRAKPDVSGFAGVYLSDFAGGSGDGGGGQGRDARRRDA